jgi:hypothetical protein
MIRGLAEAATTPASRRMAIWREKQRSAFEVMV